MTHRIVLILVAGVVGACASARPASGTDTAPSLVGTWRLTEFWDLPPNSTTKVYDYGARTCGYVIYTPSGHVSVQIARTPLPGNLPRDSVRDGMPIDGATARTMLADFASYFGTYSVDWNSHTVTHRVEGDLHRGYIASNQRRPFRLHGDSLILGDETSWRRVLLRASSADPPNPGCLPAR